MSNDADRVFVFVYGTLRYGESNSALLEGSPCLGEWRTGPAYRMFDLGGYPAVVPGGDQAILGEVYGVDAETLEALDALEGYPDFYGRTPIATPWGPAWCFLLDAPEPGARPIPGGDWVRWREVRDGQ